MKCSTTSKWTLLKNFVIKKRSSNLYKTICLLQRIKKESANNTCFSIDSPKWNRLIVISTGTTSCWKKKLIKLIFYRLKSSLSNPSSRTKHIKVKDQLLNWKIPKSPYSNTILKNSIKIWRSWVISTQAIKTRRFKSKITLDSPTDSSLQS